MRRKLKLTAVPKKDGTLLEQARLILCGLVMSTDLPEINHNAVVKWLNQFAKKN